MGAILKDPVDTQTYTSFLTTKQITTYILLALSIFSLLFVIAIGLCTAITSSSWWLRRRRSYNRRSESKPNAQVQLVCILQDTVEALSMRNHEDVSLCVKPNTRSRLSMKPPLDRLSVDHQDLPLRFQPEKLYGATTTIHRDNLRKKSCINLSVDQPQASTRRASMIESLMFLVPSTGEKSATRDSTDLPPSFSVTNTFPQLGKPKVEPMWKVGDLPQIDVTCEVDDSEPDGIEDSCENLSINLDKTIDETLSISLPIRRASATNFELSTNRLDVSKDLDVDNRENAYSDVETPNSERANTSEKRKISAYSLATKRSSLLDTLLYNPSKQKQSYFFNHPVVANAPTDSMLSRSPKPPATPVVSDPEDSGGIIALRISKSTDPDMKLIVQLLAARGLKPYRPWQKASFTLRFALTREHTTQQASINCKNSELGSMCFRESPQLKFDYTTSNKPSSSAVMGDLNINVVESLAKWAGEKEYYHGSLCIPLSDILMDTSSWYHISPAYPIIRMKADVLVSLCQRQLDGVISMGVHEVRNIQFEVKGPWEMEDINQLVDRNQLAVKIHACLTFENHLIKSKKSISLQSTNKKSEPGTSADTTPSTSRRKYSIYGPYDRLLGAENYIQFSVPVMKRSGGKLPSSNYGLLLFLNHKLPVMDHLPTACVSQLRNQGIADVKHLNAYGRCFIGDAVSQAEYRKLTGLIPKSDSPSASLWDEAMCHGSSRVYQWLNVD